MEPCPLCRCKYQKPAFAIRESGPMLALACMHCEHIGPEVPMRFPPGAASYELAAEAWNFAAMQHVTYRPARSGTASH